MIHLKAPDFEYEDPDLKDGKIRTIDQIKTTFLKGTYSLTYNYHKTVKIYAGVEILAYVAILILIIVFILIIN